VHVARGEREVLVEVVVAGQGELLEIVLATQAVGRPARLLDGGQQQPDQDGDNGDVHEQFNQREAATNLHGTSWDKRE